MIIFRYLAHEVFTTIAGLTTILLLIFLSNEFVHYLQYAANGSMPGIFVLRLMMLEIPTLLGILLPLGLYVGILLAYGRLYADSEMTVMMACGMSRQRLIGYTMILAGIIAAISAVLSLWVSPYIMRDRNRLLSVGRSASVVDLVQPKRFMSSKRGDQVLYVDSLPRSRHKADGIFLARKHKKSAAWDVVTARRAYVKHDDNIDEDYVVLEHGHQYMGEPGALDYNVIKFSRYFIRIPKPKPLVRKKERGMPTMELLPLNNPDPKKAAELQWRLSVPLMALVLGFLAVPMSRVNPRQGKFAKLLPAIVIFIIYANFLFVARRWIAAGTLSPLIGLWWLHAAMVLLALGLMYMPALKRRLSYRRGAASA